MASGKRICQLQVPRLLYGSVQAYMSWAGTIAAWHRHQRCIEWINVNLIHVPWFQPFKFTPSLMIIQTLNPPGSAPSHRKGGTSEICTSGPRMRWCVEVRAAVSTSTVPHMVSSQTNYGNGSLVKECLPKKLLNIPSDAPCIRLIYLHFVKKWPHEQGEMAAGK